MEIKKLFSGSKYAPKHAKEKLFLLCLLFLVSNTALAGGFNPQTLITNVSNLATAGVGLLIVIFGLLGLIVTGWGIYTAVQIFRGARSVQSMENPWGLVAISLIAGPALLGVSAIMEGMNSSVSGIQSTGGGGGGGGIEDLQ